MKVKYIILLLSLLAITNVNAAIDTIAPRHGAIQYSFTDLAKTKLANTYEINMPISGKLKRITLREGDKITTGQVVAQLDQKPLVLQVNSAASQLITFKEWYDLQLKTLHRSKVLRKRGFVTQQQLDQDQAYAKMLVAQIDKSKSDLNVAKYNLSQSTIYAPIDGMILNRYQEGGNWLPESTKLLQIGDLNELEGVCDVLTQDAQLLHIGDPVLLSSIGTNIVLHGKVKRIDPAGFTKKSSLGVDEQRVNIIINIINSKAANLGVGYRLQAKFLVGTQQKNALIIPRFSVLQDNKGKYYVFKLKGKKIYKQIIAIGIKTDTEISVTKGITTNDKIVAQPTADMHDGMKI